MQMPSSSPSASASAFCADSVLVTQALAATRAAAIAAARWAGRGDGKAADAAATHAMRRVLANTAGSGVVVTGEGAKDQAPMLIDGEIAGAGAGPEFDIAVDPLECTDFCACGLPGALATMALAPRGSLWSPGPAYYMEKLVVGGAGPDHCAGLDDEPEQIVEMVAAALGCELEELRVVVLDKPRHLELIARLRRTGVQVRTPSAGDVAGALQALLPDGDADLLLGIGGTPEGVMTACAARALGGAMQGRVAPQREDERERVLAAGISTEETLSLAELAPGPGAFVATGVTGGSLLAGPVFSRSGTVTTESLVITDGSVSRVRRTTTTEEL